MKRYLIALTLSLTILIITSACSLFEQNSDEVKIIPKSTPTNSSEAAKNVTPSEGSNSATQNSELGDKMISLQNATQDYIKSIINYKATEAVNALKDKDTEKLSLLADPVKGIRFSPYGHINVSSDIIMKSDDLKSASTNDKVFTWGNYDGSGQPINLTFSQYYSKFVYDKDFANAKETGYNKILGKGNTANNEFDIYPNSIIVEYYFPGFDPQYSGMDWESLRLVFEKTGSNWYITGIIHDQWTI